MKKCTLKEPDSRFTAYRAFGVQKHKDAQKRKAEDKSPKKLTPKPLSEIEADGLGVSFFGLYPQLCENGRICAQLRVQICGGVCATRRLHKLLRTADRIR